MFRKKKKILTLIVRSYEHCFTYCLNLHKNSFFHSQHTWRHTLNRTILPSVPQIFRNRCAATYGVLVECSFTRTTIYFHCALPITFQILHHCVWFSNKHYASAWVVINYIQLYFRNFKVPVTLLFLDNLVILTMLSLSLPPLPY